jgi:hypothetical protein
MHVETLLSYENGFGTTIRQPLCWRFSIENFGSGNPDTGTPPGPHSFGFQDCDTFDAKFARAVQGKQATEEEYNKRLAEKEKK